MGCSQSADGDSGHRKTVAINADESSMLTSDQVRVIRSDFAWLEANADLHAVVEQILQQMFIIEPSSRTAFLSFGHLNGEALVAHPNFQATVDAFQRAFADIVGMVGDGTAVLNYLQRLGISHRSFSTMRYEHIDAVEVAMTEVVGWEMERRYIAKESPRNLCRYRTRLADDKIRSKAAWRKLFHLMSYKMYDGYRGID
jgi:hypothetical protein